MQQHLDTARVSSLLRLVGECRELRDAGDDPGVHFLGGLASLTRAKVAIRMIGSGIDMSAPPKVEDVSDVGWSTASDRARVYEYVLRSRIDDDPLTASIFRSGERIVTMTRSDALSTRAWASTEMRNDVHRPSGIDDSLLSLFHDVRPGRVRLLALKRAWGEPAFGPEERALVHVAHTECSWAFEPRPPTHEPIAAGWSPVERETFALLLTGASEGDVVRALGLPIHAVRAHVKEICKRLGVKSARELAGAAFGRQVPAGRS